MKLFSKPRHSKAIGATSDSALGILILLLFIPVFAFASYSIPIPDGFEGDDIHDAKILSTYNDPSTRVDRCSSPYINDSTCGNGAECFDSANEGTTTTTTTYTDLESCGGRDHAFTYAVSDSSKIDVREYTSSTCVLVYNLPPAYYYADWTLSLDSHTQTICSYRCETGYVSVQSGTDQYGNIYHECIQTNPCPNGTYYQDLNGDWICSDSDPCTIEDANSHLSGSECVCNDGYAPSTIAGEAGACVPTGSSSSEGCPEGYQLDVLTHECYPAASSSSSSSSSDSSSSDSSSGEASSSSSSSPSDAEKDCAFFGINMHWDGTSCVCDDGYVPTDSDTFCEMEEFSRSSASSSQSSASNEINGPDNPLVPNTAIDTSDLAKEETLRGVLQSLNNLNDQTLTGNLLSNLTNQKLDTANDHLSGIETKLGQLNNSNQAQITATNNMNKALTGKLDASNTKLDKLDLNTKNIDSKLDALNSELGKKLDTLNDTLKGVSPDVNVTTGGGGGLSVDLNLDDSTPFSNSLSDAMSPLDGVLNQLGEFKGNMESDYNRLKGSFDTIKNTFESGIALTPVSPVNSCPKYLDNPITGTRYTVDPCELVSPYSSIIYSVIYLSGFFSILLTFTYILLHRSAD